MINYVKMNIFESPAQVIVNTVNTVGVMGKGIAKQYKQIYPDMFKKYQMYCETKQLDIGKLWLYKSETKWILNFPTKKHWRNPSKLEYIEAGLQKFVDTHEEKGITSISFPPLGCGNGGLDWESQVQPLMEKYLKSLDIDIFIHVPVNNQEFRSIEHKNISETKKWLNSQPNLLSFIEVWEDMEELIKNKKVMFKDELYSVCLKYIQEYNEEIILSDDNRILVGKTELAEAWNILKNNGVLTDKLLPTHLKKKKYELYSLLNLLPYVGTFVSLYNNANSTDLKLLPISDNVQEELF
ncbi:macro domain-containing protein [Oceanobacillus kimchii]|uniref:macro domain-containing protein n=1 Tax=Oceanobacillus kimchii TaxID=746691 RepID=UPI003C776050